MLRSERLREIRELRGLSQRKLAEELGMAHSMIYRYESGMSDPTSSTLKALSDRLHVSIDYLIGVTDEPAIHGSQLALTRDEQQMLSAFRREGWAGVIRLGADKLGAAAAHSEPGG